jgi:hypothetical protein
MIIILITIVGILLMAIGGYFINGYWWLLMIIILMAIVGILLMAIGGYFINGNWWLSMVIILVVIGSYYIISYLKLYFIGYCFLF